MSGTYITAIDLGSSHIKTVVAEIKKDGTVVLLKAFKKQSGGIKRGEIVDPEETFKYLFDAYSEVRHFDKKCLENIYFGISGSKSRIILSRAGVVIARPNSEILSEDMDRVLKDSRAINLPPGWQIINSFPREFVVDGIEVDESSVEGLSGKKLEANVIHVAMFSAIYNNFIKLKRLVLKKEEQGAIYFVPLASERSILTKKQRDLGVLMVDIGQDTTGVVVYQEGKLLTAKVLPFGSGNVTTDIAIGLRCTMETAEALKISLGCANSKDVSNKDKVDLSQYEEELTAQVQKKFIAEIIESRIKEIFTQVNEELKIIGKAGKLPSGVVITGGGSKLSGICDLARQELRMASSLGFPIQAQFEASNAQVADAVDDPEMTVACGLVLQYYDMIMKKCANMGSSYGWKEPWYKSLFKIFIKNS